MQDVASGTHAAAIVSLRRKSLTSGLNAEEATVAEARAHVGTPAVGVRVGRDAVNLAMINHWCDAIGDRNPAYAEASASATRHGGVIAPPALLGSWTMDAEADVAGGPRDQVLRRLEQLGYTAVVATNYEQEYLRQLRPGDRLSEAISIETLSDRKETGLGTGYFVTVRHDYSDQSGELVGVARMRLLKFKPKERGDKSAPPQADQSVAQRPRPPTNRDNAFFWEAVARGELLLQRCASCGRLRHPPGPMCGRCRSTEWDTVASTGRGTVYSYVVHHHPPLPGIELPLIVVLVELEEGVRLVSNLVDAEPDEVAIGQRVQVDFRNVDDELILPLFVLSEAP